MRIIPVILEVTPLHNAGLFPSSNHGGNDFAHGGASVGGYGLDGRCVLLGAPLSSKLETRTITSTDAR